MLLRTIRTTLACLAIILLGGKLSGQNCNPNLIVNGGFENGNTGFTSDLTYAGATLGGAGDNYAINSNAQNANAGFNSVAAHNGSSFLIVDGSITNPTRVWEQTVNSLVPGNTYVFGFWAVNIHTGYPPAQSPALTGEISNVTVITTGVLLTSTWTFFSYTYTATGTSAVLRIKQANFVWAGNDFALDDITFKGSNLTASATAACTGFCNGTSAVSVLNATGAISYSWNTIPVQTTQTATGLCSGDYTVTVTDAIGCTAKDSVTVKCPCEGCNNVHNDCPVFTPVADQDCFWSTGGNGSATVNGNKNYIGTAANNNTPVRIFTNGIERVHVNAGNGSNAGNVGIGTATPGNRLEINTSAATPAAGQTGFSGLRFKDLNSTHAPGNGNGKVLSVNAAGDVILVSDNTIAAPADYEKNQQAARLAERDARIAALENKISAIETALASCCASYEQQSSRAEGIRDEKASLEQNEPNPFFEKTTIHYYVPSGSINAVIKIFNFSGIVLKSVEVPPGRGQIIFEGGELAQGTYVYTLFIGDKQADSKWMMLTK